MVDCGRKEMQLKNEVKGETVECHVMKKENELFIERNITGKR